MAERLTTVGRNLLASHQGNGTHLQVDKIVLAYVPGQSPSDVIDPGRRLPPTDQIIDWFDVTHDGYMSPDMVVYSLYMDATVGPFTFNTLYAVASGENNAVVMIVTLPDTPKIADDPGEGVRGQPMVRNTVLVYDDAAAITNVTVEAEAWQFAYENATTEVRGLGEVATEAEAITGNDKWRWITPFTLHKYIAAWWEALDLNLSWDAITKKPEKYPPASHKHDYSELTGFGNAATRLIGTANSNIPDMGFYGRDLSSIGYQEIPGGLFIQWGWSVGPIPVQIKLKLLHFRWRSKRLLLPIRP